MKSCVYVSDLHLNAGWSRKYPGRYKEFEWLSAQQKASFISFLRWLNPKRVQRLVILGDALDNWIYPAEARPPTIHDVVEANMDVWAELMRLSRSIQVTVVSGNHDMDLGVADIARMLPEIPPAAPLFIFRDGPVHAEHGHQYCMFNRRDPRGPVNALPCGYYISRAVATHDARTDGPAWHSAVHLGTLLASGASIPGTVLDAVLFWAGIPVDGAFVMADGSRVEVAAVKEAFGGLWSHWPADKVVSVLAEFNQMTPAATKLFRDGVRIVIFGHSHVPKLQEVEDGSSGEPNIYANTGSWSSHRDGSGDYVEVFRDEGEDRMVVQLRVWKQNESRVVKQASISHSS